MAAQDDSHQTHQRLVQGIHCVEGEIVESNINLMKLTLNAFFSIRF
jgi:hypothetical protein